MFLKIADGVSKHKCDRCGNYFGIPQDKEKHAQRHLIILAGRAITHRGDDTHECNGLSYCGSCSEIIMEIMDLDFPRF